MSPRLRRRERVPCANPLGIGASRNAPSGTERSLVRVSMRGWPVIASSFVRGDKTAAFTLSARNQSALQAVNFALTISARQKRRKP